MRFDDRYPLIGGGRYWYETTTLALPSDRSLNTIGPIIGGVVEINFVNKARDFHLPSSFQSDLATGWISRKRQFVAFVEAPTAKCSRDVKGKNFSGK